MTEPSVEGLRDLPERIVVGANGAYWRDYGDHYSMAVVSTDNDPVVPVATFVRAHSDLGDEIDAIAEALNALDVVLEEEDVSETMMEAATEVARTWTAFIVARRESAAFVALAGLDVAGTEATDEQYSLNVRRAERAFDEQWRRATLDAARAGEGLREHDINCGIPTDTNPEPMGCTCGLDWHDMEEHDAARAGEGLREALDVALFAWLDSPDPDDPITEEALTSAGMKYRAALHPDTNEYDKGNDDQRRKDETGHEPKPGSIEEAQEAEPAAPDWKSLRKDVKR